MICKNCGANIQDGSPFCNFCGNKTGETLPASQQQYPQPGQPTPVPQQQYPQPEQPAPVPQQQYPQPQQYIQPPMYPVQPKKSKAGLIVGIIIAVVLIAGGVASYFIFFANKGGNTSSETTGESASSSPVSENAQKPSNTAPSENATTAGTSASDEANSGKEYTAKLYVGDHESNISGDYYGNWENGKPEGQGTLIYTFVDAYTGETITGTITGTWKNGLLDGSDCSLKEDSSYYHLIVSGKFTEGKFIEGTEYSEHINDDGSKFIYKYIYENGEEKESHTTTYDANGNIISEE